MNLTGVAGVDPSVPASQDDLKMCLRSIARTIKCISVLSTTRKTAQHLPHRE
jgi:hypothetical protein